MRTILIVENCADLGTLHQEELDTASYHTLRARSGCEALKLMAAT